MTEALACPVLWVVPVGEHVWATVQAPNRGEASLAARDRSRWLDVHVSTKRPSASDQALLDSGTA